MDDDLKGMEQDMMKQKPNKEIEVLEDNIREALTKLESDTKKVKTNAKADC